jgi:hypothetical protein
MRVCHRFGIASLTCAFGLALACGGKTSGPGGGGGGSPCDDYFQAVFSSSCQGNVVPPASELTRIQSRFDTLCAAALALPGLTFNSSNLEACASAIKSSGCTVVEQDPGPCSFDETGTLATGAACVSDDQCQSDECSAGSETSDGGTSICGTCGATVAVGQSCQDGQQCPAKSACTGTGGSLTCAAITYGAAGASCNGSSLQCNTGLVCNTAEQCAAPAGSGAGCNTDQQCASPLVCPAVSGASTCQNANMAGGPCAGSGDCTSGLTCDFTTHQCATVTWVDAGQPCSETALCLVGSCPTTGTSTTGTCPTVISDGQPCNGNSTTSTCDTFAQCTAGTCVLGYPSCP